jgi:hypothetical protein
VCDLSVPPHVSRSRTLACYFLLPLAEVDEPADR